MIGEPSDPLFMGIVDGTGASSQFLGQKGMIDAEPVIPRAEPGVFAPVWIAVSPQIAKSDLLDRIHIMRCRVDRPRLVEICATSIKVADGQCTVPLGDDKAAISASQ